VSYTSNGVWPWSSYAALMGQAPCPPWLDRAAVWGYAPETVSFEAGRIMLRRLHGLALSGSSFAFESTLSSRTFVKFLRDSKADFLSVKVCTAKMNSA
jgi:predicted ABC-type ATPase